MTLTDISTYSVIVPTVIGLIRFRYLAPALKVIFLLVAIGCTVEMLSLPVFGGMGSSLPIYVVYTLIEYLLISLFYYLLARNALQQKIIFFGSIIYICIFLAVLNGVDNIGAHFGYLSAAESVLIVLWVLLYLRQIMYHQIDMDLKRSPTFWISTGFLLYFLGSFFLFASFSLLMQDAAVAIQFYDVIHSALNIINYLLICIGFYFSTRV